MRVRNRQACKAARKGQCEYCGEKAHGGAHHIVHKEEKGPDIKENLIQLCRACHVACHSSRQRSIGKEELFSIVAKRENMSLEAVQAKVNSLIPAQKGVMPVDTSTGK